MMCVLSGGNAAWGTVAARSKAQERVTMGILHEDTASLRLRLEQVSIQVEELKVWSDAQLRLLQNRLHAQIAQLQSEIARMQSEPLVEGPGDYSARIETQLQQLAAKGDAVYDLIRRQLEQQSGQLPRGDVPGRSGDDTGNGATTPEPPVGGQVHLDFPPPGVEPPPA